MQQNDRVKTAKVRKLMIMDKKGEVIDTTGREMNYGPMMSEYKAKFNP